MARILVLTLTALSVVGTGCQKAKMGSTPPKPVVQAGPQSVGPVGPGAPIGPRQPLPMPMPPRWGELEPRDPMNPVIVGPPPPPPTPTLPPRAGEADPWDPRVVPVNPTPPTQPKPPLTDVIPSEQRGQVPTRPEPFPTQTVPTQASPPQAPPPPQAELPPTRPEGPIAPAPQPQVAALPTSGLAPQAASVPAVTPAPRSAAISAPPPARDEMPVGAIRPQGFNTYRDVPSARAKPTHIVPVPAAEKTVAEKPIPTAPTQVIQNLPAECIGREGKECTPPKSVADECEATPLEKKKEKGKLDILFVTDTSLSLRGGLAREGGELAQVAREMENFVYELPLDTDIQIAVMLGHGPATHWNGRLFNAGKGDQTVVKIPAARSKEERARSAQLAGRILTNKMIKVPNESKGAQGEAMLLSLYNGLSNKAKLAHMMKNDKFFRSDAALNVIFVSDEQDVCFDYDAANKANPGNPIEPRKKIVKKPITKNVGKKTKITGFREDSVIDPYETDFFERTCKKAVQTGREQYRALTPGDVHQALKNLMGGRPMILSALAYKTNNIPVGLEDENEMGHGIIDLVEHVGGGQVVDLASITRNGKEVSFAKELKYLGQFANFQIRYTNVWDCKSKTHPIAVNSSSVKLRVIGKHGEELASFSGAKGEVEALTATGGSGGKIYSQFRVNHERLSKALKGKNTDNAVVTIEFMTRTDVERISGNRLR